MVFKKRSLLDNTSLKTLPRSPLKNGLLVRRWVSNTFLRLLNALLRIRKNHAPLPPSPKKILLCNIANFGDVIISTTVLPLLKKQFPELEIGFLTATRTASILANHPLISKIHCFDHWYLNRSKGLCKAALHHIQTARQSLKEIKETNYDLSIDLYSYFPNAIPLSFRAKIPVRIGYSTGGFSNLLTHSIPWESHTEYVGYAHFKLLQVLGINISQASPLPDYTLSSPPTNLPTNYVIVHMGTAHELKEWETRKWIQLIKKLQENGLTIVLTGQGQREQDLCKLVATETSCLNLCNQLSWAEFVFVIQHANLLISVDSVAVHIAAAVQIPSLVLFSGINSPHMWAPPHSLCKVLIHQLPCAPCFNRKGCLAMSCIRGIHANEAYQNALELLKINKKTKTEEMESRLTRSL